MFWNKKKTEDSETDPVVQAVETAMPEPTEEQLREEQELADRLPDEKKRVTGETTKILRLTLGVIDRSIEEKKSVREAAKKLQESVAQVGANLRLKKA